MDVLAGIRRMTALTAVVALLATALTSVPATASTDVPNPTVEGPVTGGIHGRPWHSTVPDIEKAGFVEEEFFLSGTSGSAPYKTRIVVRRPKAAKKFSGTVVVDWINVTGGTDLETLWPPAVPMYLKHGHAYVGLTAQAVGVNGLRTWDPARYGSLLHPGDTPHSYEILAQAIQAIRSPDALSPMGRLKVERVIVGGSSQSAGRLVSYISGGYPITGHIDGFWISRAGGGQAIADTAKKLRVPMIHSFEEGLAEQPENNAFYRVWEGAGQAHAPKSWHDYVWQVYQRDLWANAADLPNPLDAGCAMNRGTVQYQIRAGLHRLHEWLVDGARAPVAPRIERDADGEQVRDADGHVVGGLRYPFVEVPLATNSSKGCPLFGSHRAWSQEKILEHYPTHAAYYKKVKASVRQLKRDGFLQPYDARTILKEAAKFDVWGKAGSCYDTSKPGADEAGPVSGTLHGMRNEHSPVGYGVPAATGEVSCSFAALGL